MFGIILISACTLMHVYVFWRIASVPFVDRHVTRKVIIGTGVFLWATFFFGRVVGHGSTGALATVLELLGMNWMAALFLAFVPLLATDLVTAFGFIVPRLAPSLRGWALVAGGVLSIVALFQGLRPPVVQSYEVRLPGLPERMDGTVIVAMSDLHLGSVLGERWLEARVTRSQGPAGPTWWFCLAISSKGTSGPRMNCFRSWVVCQLRLACGLSPGTTSSTRATAP